MRRFMLLVLTLLLGCSLDLDRLRAGAGSDAGRDATLDDAQVDASSEDATSEDASSDAQGGDAGPCPCHEGSLSREFEIIGTTPTFLALRDLDGDGDDDIFANVEGGVQSLVVMQMSLDGCGSLVAATNRFDVVEPGTRFAVVDWTSEADLVPDVVATRFGDSFVALLRGTLVSGAYMLADASVTAGAQMGTRVVVPFQAGADDTGDHAVITLAAGGGTFIRFDGSGATTALSFSTHGTGVDVAFESYRDGDRYGVVALGTGGIDFFRYTPPNILQPQSLLGVGTMDIRDVEMFDVDADGFEDVVALDVMSRVLRYYAGDGTGTFTEGPSVGVGDAFAMTRADVIGDGRDEVILLSSDSFAVLQWLGTGFSSMSTVAGEGLASIASGDVDGDGQDDIVVGSSRLGASRVTVHLGACRH